MERLSMTENSSVLSTKEPLDVASTKGNKKITNNILQEDFYVERYCRKQWYYSKKAISLHRVRI